MKERATSVGCFPYPRTVSPGRARPRFVAIALAASLVGVLASCRPASEILPNDVRSYSVPKMVAATAAPAPQRSPSLRYDLPAGWVDVGASGMRLATLRTAADTADPADIGEITIIPASGTLLGNATRWQEQLTPQADAERVARAIEEGEKIDVDGVEATILLLLDDAEQNQQAILAAVIPVDDTTSLFVKFKGAAALAHRLREPFTAFVSSIRWK